MRSSDSRASRIGRLTLVCSVGFALGACVETLGGRGVDASTSEDAAVADGDASMDDQDAGAPVITGAAEKGPFVLGSSVTISAVDNDGDPTGDVFNTQTTSDLGRFEVEVGHPGPVELAATGYYYNEATGALSVAPLTLRGWYRVLPSGEQTANLNVITHLTNRRVHALFAGGVSLQAAIAQAESELVAALGIGAPPTSIGGTSLDVSSSGYLLAVSAVLAEAGRERAGGDGGADAALQELLNSIASDLEGDGAIESALHDEIVAAQTLDIQAVMDRLAARYEALGNPITVPDLNEQLDSDLDGLINSDDNCPHVANPGQEDGNGDGVGDACCGDGTIEGDEACDDGELNADTAACTTTCEAAFCGDTLTWGEQEECDDGNDIDDDGCDTNCTVSACGNGIEAGSEACDDGNDVEGDGCDTNCTVSACGNGIQASSEDCDDGNDISGDGCNPDCTLTATLSALLPASAAMGSPNLTVTVDGGGFLSGVQVMFGDTALSTEFTGSSIRVTAVIPASLMAVAGEVQVAVINPGQAASSALTFTVQGPAPSTWEFTGDLSSGCQNCTASLLVNGQVLIVGGRGNSGLRATASLYDPISGLFSDTDPLDTARDAHRSVRLQDGRVLVAGGYSDRQNNVVTASVEAYDPGTGFWTTVAPMNVQRADHAMVLLADGTVLASGGRLGGDGANYTKTAETYDPLSNTWTSAGDMVERYRFAHTATLLTSGEVLAVGGEDNGSSCELYDPITRGWRSTGSPFAPRSSSVAVLLPNGKVLVTGGDTPGGVVRSELYDPTTGQWSSVFSTVQRSYGLRAVLLATGKVLVAGGVGAGGNLLTSAELFDPDTNTWSVVSSMLQARSDFALTVLASGEVLAAAGWNGVNPELEPTAELWDPANP